MSVPQVAITPRRRQHLDELHQRMGTRLTLLKLHLVDVFAIALYNPNDHTDERVLDVIDHLVRDVGALQATLCRWQAQRERRIRLAAQSGQSKEESGTR
jgi:hypothetical protein